MPELQRTKVSFTPFLSETFDVQQLKRNIMFDLDELEDMAQQLPIHMRLLQSEISSILDVTEMQELNTLIDTTTRYVNSLSFSEHIEDTATYNYYYAKIENECSVFLSKISELFLSHGLSFGLKNNKAITPWDMLARVVDIPGWRYNNVGFPVTYQQRVLAEFAVERTQSKYDFTMLVVGKRGRGKSTFIAELMSTYLELQGKKFDLSNVMLTEDKQKAFATVKGWTPGAGTIFDEAINQLFSRDFLKSQDFISLLTEVRYKRAFVAFLIPELFQIDKIVREGLADVVVTITERGLAVLQAPSLLTGTERYMVKQPDEPVLTPTEHTEVLLKNSLNSILAIPYLEIPTNNELWSAYESIKDNKINAKKFEVKQQASGKLKSDDYYYQFTKMLGKNMPKGKHVVTAKEIADYSKHVMYSLNTAGYASWFAKQLGVRKADMLILKPDGSADVDISIPLINAYIMKLGEDK